MKTKQVVLCAFVLAAIVALAGCGQQVASSNSSGSSGAGPSASSSSMVSMANPWSDAATAQAAADGAGVGEFVVPVDAEITLGPLNMVTYRYMKGIAQADVEFPAVSMTIRKGVGSDGDDISGDYNGYANTWTQDIGGIQVKCAGNRKGESTKTTWRNGDAVYSICVLGLGGDTDYGLPAEDLEILVPAIR